MKLKFIKIWSCLKLQIEANIVKYIKKKKWLMEVPIGFLTIFGWVARSPCKKYPKRLPGNKYRINSDVKEK